MANSTLAVTHNHEHATQPSPVTVAYSEMSEWAHTHCHAHNCRQSHSQAYSFEHSHAHIHPAGTPKHALTDLGPEEKAHIGQLCGRCSLDGHLEAMGVRDGAEVSLVTPQNGGGVSLQIDGRTVSLSADEAASVIVEVQK